MPGSMGLFWVMIFNTWAPACIAQRVTLNLFHISATISAIYPVYVERLSSNWFSRVDHFVQFLVYFYRLELVSIDQHRSESGFWSNCDVYDMIDTDENSNKFRSSKSIQTKIQIYSCSNNIFEYLYPSHSNKHSKGRHP